MTINELLEYLDGNGMVYVDEDLVTKALSEIGHAPFDEFETLREQKQNKIKVEILGGVAHCDDPRVKIIDHDNY
jgi:hypothetical protein